MFLNKRFGELLTEGIYSIAGRWQKSIAIVEEEIAHSVQYSRPMLQKWRQGRNLPKEPETIKELAIYCVKNSRLNREWAESFLLHGRYPHREQLLKTLFSSSEGSKSQYLPDLELNLESPEGIIEPHSSFYVERPSDHIVLEKIRQGRGETITLKGPRQVGKSSLLMRMVKTASEEGKRVALIDLQLINRNFLQNAHKFFEEFCAWLNDELEIEGDFLKQHWSQMGGYTQRCTRYIRALLKELEQPLVLAIDELETVFKTDFYDDFLGMLRGWHNQRVRPDQPIWKRLDLILVSSMEPLFFIRDPYRSPFHAGTRIKLADFNRSQVAELNRCYATPFTEDQLNNLMDLLHGHPYLVRKALHWVRTNQVKETELFTHIWDHKGPFSEHLHYYWNILQFSEKPEQLRQGLKQAIEGCWSEDEFTFFQLEGLGLVKKEKGKVVPRCQLYADYFGPRLKN